MDPALVFGWLTGSEEGIWGRENFFFAGDLLVARAQQATSILEKKSDPGNENLQ